MQIKYVCFPFFLSQKVSKGKLCKMTMLNLENRILYKQPCLFSAMVVTGKLRVN